MDAIDMMLRYSARPEATGPDLSGWPADVAEVLQVLHEVWKLDPPTTKKEKGDWCIGARALKKACAEFKMYELLDVLHKDWMDKANQNHGIPPYFVGRPHALLIQVRSLVGLWRSMAGESAEDRNRYVEGPYSGFIEH